MIDTLYLANYFEEQFNNNSLGKKFLIFADEGELKKSSKNGNKVTRFTHGLLETISSQVIPIKNLTFQTWNLQLMIFADLIYMGDKIQGENERSQSKNLIEIKECIQEVSSRLNGQTLPLTIEDRTYAMTFGFSLPTTGQKMSLGEMQECLPLYLSISITLFENGVNSNDYEVIIDGENVYSTDAIITRLKVTEQSPDFNGNNTKATILNNGIGIDLIMPQTTSKLCDKIEDEILDGTDKAYCVILKKNNRKTPFLCTILKEQLSIKLLQNAGFNLSFAEGVEECLDFEENKWIFIPKEILRGTIESYFFNSSGKEIIVFWGDGSKEITSETNIKHTYKDNGFYTIRAYCEEENVNDWFYELINYYEITYQLDGGIADNPSFYNEEMLPIVLNNPNKLGYNFTGWTGTGIDQETLNITIPIGMQGGLNYIAHYIPIEYEIKYDYQNGKATNKTRYTIETPTFTLNNPTRTGYDFAGWSGTNITNMQQRVVIEIGSYGNREYTANWKGKNYHLIYDIDGGEANPPGPPYAMPEFPPSDKIVTYGERIGTLFNPSYVKKIVGNTTYYGESWSIDGEKINSGMDWEWTEDKTAKINWVVVPGV